MTEARDYGEGTVYLRGRTWWITYHHQGRRFSESSKSRNKRDATRLLRKRKSEIDVGRFVGNPEKLTFHDLREIIRSDYIARGRKSWDRAARALKRVAQEFGDEGCRCCGHTCEKHTVEPCRAPATAIAADPLHRYVASRLEEGAARGTIRAELSALKRAMRLAWKRDRLASIPNFPGVQADNPRQGFFEDSDVQDVLTHLPEYLRAPVEFAYYTGWRFRSEVLRLTWDRVDLEAGIVRLDPGTTKNNKGREFPLMPELDALLRSQKTKTRALERTTNRIIQSVFHNDGEPVRDHYHAWRAACKKAGVPGRLVHDLRRTAVRNLVRAGVPDRTAMELTGHLTRKVFDAYNIVNDADRRDGVARLGQYMQKKREESPKKQRDRSHAIG